MVSEPHMIARDAARALGAHVSAARRRRGETAEMVARRAGISPVTLRKIERGDPSVKLGTAFDVAVLVGVPLFGTTDAARMTATADRLLAELALLPQRIDPVHDDELDDDF